MDDPKSRDVERSRFVKAWHAYGAEFSVFVPDHQPAPTTWEPHVEEFDEEHVFMRDRAADSLYRINGPAVKADVWLLCRQEELARSTRWPELEVSDKEPAEELGVSEVTACSYREELARLRLVTVKTRIGS
ncbi:MAG: hypothetical protein V2B18_20850 [Pseudomonadota bacterium]